MPEGAAECGALGGRGEGGEGARAARSARLKIKKQVLEGEFVSVSIFQKQGLRFSGVPWYSRNKACIFVICFICKKTGAFSESRFLMSEVPQYTGS